MASHAYVFDFLDKNGNQIDLDENIEVSASSSTTADSSYNVYTLKKGFTDSSIYAISLYNGAGTAIFTNKPFTRNGNTLEGTYGRSSSYTWDSSGVVFIFKTADERDTFKNNFTYSSDITFVTNLSFSITGTYSNTIYDISTHTPYYALRIYSTITLVASDENFSVKFLSLEQNEGSTTYTVTQNLTNCTSNIESSSYDENTELSFTLTANDGYQFDSTPTTNIGSFTVSDDKLTATATITLTENLTITAVANEIPIATYTATYNLTNVTCNRSATEFESGTYTFTIEYNSGYRLDYTPYIESASGTISEFSHLTDNIYSLSYTVNEDFTVYGSASEIVNYTITQNLTNCTSNVTESTVESGTQLEFTITPTSNYQFTTIKAVMNETEYVFTINEDNSATLSITVTNNLVITAIASIDIYTITYNITNCEINTSSGTVEKGTVIDFEINALSGYYFSTPPVITYGENTEEFTLDSETGIYKYSYTANSDANIIATAIEESATTGYGYINMYVVDTDDLNIIATERILKSIVPVTDDTTKVEYLDKSEYLLTLSGLYIPISATNSDYIHYGGYISSAIGQIPDSEIVTIDGGTITIPELYGNSIDYKNTTIEMFIPFVGNVSLETAKYMNCTISISATINILTGNMTTKLENKTNGIIEYFTGTVSFEIPMKYDNVLNQNINDNTKYTQGLTPFVIVSNNVPDNEDFANLYGQNCDYVGIIGDYSGFNQIELLQLVKNSYLYKDDEEEIKTILNGGIIL